MSDKNIIDCEEALSRLFEYLDHELHEHKHDEMDEHLSRCRSCYSRYEFEKRLRDHLQKATKAKAPNALHDKMKLLIKKL